MHPEGRGTLREALRTALHEHEPYDFEHRILRPDGEVRVVHRRAEVVRGEGDEPLLMVGTVHDVTERKALEERLSHQALHDPLTGLPNRTLLMDRLSHALTRAGRRGNGVAVLFTELDNFKYANDSLGHEVGDRLLSEVASRLRTLLRPEDTLARHGGDEFVVLLEEVESEAEAVRVAERIREGLRAPFSLGGREIFVTTSTGVACGGRAGDRPEDLLRDADAAMYRAKELGKDHHALFNPEMKERSSRRLGLEGDLRRALDTPDEEFRLFYQPKVSLGSGEIVGVEGLLRWQHPKRGMVLPSEFMPLAEETGLIVPLGRWVLEEACRQGRKWRTQYSVVRPLFVTVNLSARQFRVPGLAGEVRHVLARTGLEPGGLILEITESALMEDVTTTLAALRWLQDFGVRLAIDDFGTGYSSLSYLKRFPVDAIKVDRSIVSGLGQDPGDAAIVSATITLAHALGLEVVAEGVETEAEVAELRSLGCDLAQGYYFWKPVPAQESAALLASSLRSDPHGPRTTQQRIGSSASSVDDAKISGTPRAAQP